MTIHPVCIVGAGPGDPSLISVRGLRYVTTADVIVHDHLVHPRLLRQARADAELIDVGAAAPQPQEQDAICLLLVEKAREGRRVVRLKWGDPFVFDSGGRAALFLHEQGVPFEVVPGIPALVAVPCHAGIPLTYPGAGDTVTLIRGYEDESSAPPEVEWSRLAPMEGTVVCYAGARQLPFIVDSLLSHGRPPDDWAAVIYDGALPQQRTIHGTLKDIARAVASRRAVQPGILIVGPVVGLREHLRWFDARPLFGRRILVTRSREQASELVERLEELGAQAIEAPSIRILPASDTEALDEAGRTAGEYDWLVFTSANGVAHFMDRLLLGPYDVRHLKGPKLCAIGPATAERLARYGLKVDIMPAEHRAEAVVQAMRHVGRVKDTRVLFPRADIARDVLPDELRREGAEVHEVVAYRTVRGLQERGPDIYKMLLDREIDVVTFTSASTVRHFAANLGEDQTIDLLRTTIVAAIGPVTAEAAQQLGITPTIVPTEYTIAALVQAIVAHFQQTTPAGATQPR